jgi:hypothetical protein
MIRRKALYERVPVTGWVEILEQDGAKPFDGYVLNISRDGMGLYATRMLRSGTNVTLKLYFLGQEGLETVEGLKGMITWCFESGRFITLGVRFVKPITAEISKDLMAYLEEGEKTVRERMSSSS